MPSKKRASTEAKPGRDEFPRRLVVRLRERVGNRCSNPDCGIQTTGPGADDESVATIGVAAHITAASIGGPRYDANLNSEQRKAIKNAVWLCANCSTEIDRDVAAHPVELLHRWRAQAEEAARKGRGRAPTDPRETSETLAIALSGYPQKLVPNAIRNVHAASAVALESLDPRFRVSSAFQEGASHFTIEAREPAEFSLEVDTSIDPAAAQKFADLHEMGRGVEIDTRAISFKGSKLLEAITAEGGEGGVLRLSPPTKEATLQIWIYQKSGGRERVDDIRGHITIGRKQANFEGSCLGGLFRVAYSHVYESGGRATTVNLTVNLETWDGLDVRSLPHRDALKDLMFHFAQGTEIETALVVEGQRILSSKRAPMPDASFARTILPFALYIDYASQIAAYLDVHVPCKSDIRFSGDDLSQLERLARMTEPQGFEFSSVGREVSMEISLEEDFEDLRMAAQKRSNDWAMQRNGETVALFGEIVEVPTQLIQFFGVAPRFSKPPKRWKSGDAIKIVLKPIASRFRGIMRFLSHGSLRDQGEQSKTV